MRIYSPNKNGVRVRTTIRKLTQSVDGYSNGDGEFFIGMVQYEEESRLRQQLVDHGWLRTEIEVSRNQATSLLFKRLEFRHESEIRLLYLEGPYGRKSESLIFQHEIDPGRVFEELQFDPRLSAELYDLYHYYFHAKLQFPGGITQSELYRAPEFGY